MRAQEASCLLGDSRAKCYKKKAWMSGPGLSCLPQRTRETQAPLPQEGQLTASGKVRGRRLFPHKGPFSPFQQEVTPSSPRGLGSLAGRAESSLRVEVHSGTVKVIARCRCRVSSCAPGPRRSPAAAQPRPRTPGSPRPPRPPLHREGSGQQTQPACSLRPLSFRALTLV